MRPIDHFELGGEKPLGHRPGRVDWWRAFAVSGPCGMHDEPHFGPRDTLETAARKWLHAVDDGELDIAPTAEELRLAIARGRVVVNNKYTGPYVVAHPWEQSAFCKDCRTVLEVRAFLSKPGLDLDVPETFEFVERRRVVQYGGLCFLCREEKVCEGLHDFDRAKADHPDNWVMLCEKCVEDVQGSPDLDLAEYLANHVTDYPGVDHTVLKLEDPPLRDELSVRRLSP